MRSKKSVLGCISALAILLGSIPMEMMNVEAEDTVGTTYYDVATTENLKLHGVTYDAEDGIYRRMDLDKAADIAKILKKDDPEKGVETRQEYDFVDVSEDVDTGEITNSFKNNVYPHAREAAGGRIRFSTNSANVSVKATLKNHFSDYAKSMKDGKYGFDVYVDTEEGSTYVDTLTVKWIEDPNNEGTMIIDPSQFDSKDSSIIDLEDTATFDSAEERNLTIYFPITVEVKSVEIGVDTGSTLEPHNADYKENEKILFYGSSITQGGAVTKPGNTYVNIVGRNLNTDYLNLGMWGSCHAEAEFAEYIADLKDTEGFTAFVYDYDHNNRSKKDLKETHYRFYEIVREAYPDIPIIMITRPGNNLNAQHASEPDKYSTVEEMKAVIYDSYVKACLNGDENVHFIDGESFFGYGKGYMADGSHPNDAGQAKMAEVVTAVLKQAYAGEKNLCVRPSVCEEQVLSENFENAVSGEVPSGWSQACGGKGLVADSDSFSLEKDEKENKLYQIQYNKIADESVTTHFGLTGTLLSNVSKCAIEMDATLYESTKGSFPYLGLRLGTGDSRQNGYEIRVMARNNGCAVYFVDRTDGTPLTLDGVAIEDEQMAADFAEGVMDYHLRVECEHVITGNGKQQIAISVYVNDKTPVKGFFYPKVANFAPDSIRLFMYPQNNAASGVQKVTMDNIKIYKYGHTLTPQSEIPATIEEVGTKAHYVCSCCQKKYLDDTGFIEVMDRDLVLPQIVPCMVLDEKFDNGDAWTANASNTADGKEGFKVITEGNESQYQLAYTRAPKEVISSAPSGWIHYNPTISDEMTDYILEMDATLHKAANGKWSYLGVRLLDSGKSQNYELRIEPKAKGVYVSIVDKTNGSTTHQKIIDELTSVYTGSEYSYHVRMEVDKYVDAEGSDRVKISIYLDDNNAVIFDDALANPEFVAANLRVYLFVGTVTENTLYKATIDNLQIYTLTHPTEKMSATEAVPSEWGKAGTKEYHTCGVCGEEFLDAEGTILRTDANKNFAALNEIECQTRPKGNGLTDLRFVAYVDDYSLYPKIEFVVKSETAAGVPTLDRTMICNSVYYGVVADDQFVNTGDVYGQAGTFAAIKIMNNTVEHLQENMTITVKWYGADGNVAKETTREICVFDEMPQQ